VGDDPVADAQSHLALLAFVTAFVLLVVPR